MAPSQITNGLLHPLNRGRLHLTNRGLSHPTNHRRLSSMNRGRLHRAIMSAAVPRPCITSPGTHYRNKATKRRLQPALCPRCPCGTDDAVSNQRTPPVSAAGARTQVPKPTVADEEAAGLGSGEGNRAVGRSYQLRADPGLPGYVPRKPKWMMETSYRGRRKRLRSGLCSLMCLAPVGPP
jgi:hypothetical protein